MTRWVRILAVISYVQITCAVVVELNICEQDHRCEMREL